MTWWTWARRRVRASWSLVLTIAALVAAASAIVGVTIGHSGAAATSAARTALAEGAATESAVRVTTREAADPEAQDAEVRGIVADSFGRIPVEVTRSVLSDPQQLPADGGGAGKDAWTGAPSKAVVLAGGGLDASSPGFAQRVDVVEGTWPTGTLGEGAPAPAGLPVGAADRLGLGVGDELRVGGVPVRVSALWRPVDPTDPAWFDDPLLTATAAEQDTPVALVVADGAVVTRFGQSPLVRWTVRPVAEALETEDLPVLADAAERLRTRLKGSAADVRGVVAEGELAGTAATAGRELATARALGTIPLFVLVVVCVIAVIQLARLLARAREEEIDLLMARGAAPGQLVAVSLAEALATAAVGTVVGTAGAMLVVVQLPAGHGQLRQVAVAGLASGLAVLLALTAVTVTQVRRIAARRSADRSGRTRSVAAAGTAILVVGAAALAWWQLRRNGSPLVPVDQVAPGGPTSTDQAAAVDLVAGAAPALLLLAGGLVALALLGPLARMVEGLARPTRSLTVPLAAAQVARHLPVHAASVVLTVLAVGATTLAALYAGTSAGLRDDLRAVEQGSAVRVTLVDQPREVREGHVPEPWPTFADVTGVSGTAAVRLDPHATVGDLDVPAVVGDLAAVRAVALRPQDVPIPGTISDRAEGAGATGDGAHSTAAPAASRTAGHGTGADAGADAGDGADARSVPVPEGTEEVLFHIRATLELSQEEADRLTDLQAGVAEWQRGEEVGDVPADERTPEPAVRELLQQQLRASVDAMREPTPGTVGVRVTDLDAGETYEVPLGTVQLALDPPEDPARLGALTATQELELPLRLQPDRRYTLDAVQLPILAVGGTQPEIMVLLDSTLEVRARTVPGGVAGGADLFGPATTGWGSTSALPPDQAAELLREIEAQEADGAEDSTPQDDVVSSSFPAPVLDTSTATWRLELQTRGSAESLNVAPGLTVDLTSGSPTGPGTDPGRSGGERPADPVPVILTRDAATAANLSAGDAFSISVFGSPVPAELAAVSDAVPGSLEPRAALVDASGLLAAYAAEGRELPSTPPQVWLASEDPQATTRALRDDPRVVGARAAEPLPETDAAGAAGLIFWVAAAGSVLLALTGIATVAATLLRSRRPEVVVLRALGMPPRAQASSRALELGGVVLAASVLGLSAGWLVGRSVVPELASSTTDPEQVRLPAQLVLQPAPWAGLLTLLLAGTTLVLLVLAGRVRAQALVSDYREEIR